MADLSAEVEGEVLRIAARGGCGRGHRGFVGGGAGEVVPLGCGLRFRAAAAVDQGRGVGLYRAAPGGFGEEQGHRNLGDKAGDGVALDIAEDHARGGVGHEQLLFGPRDPDIAEPALLFQLGLAAHRPEMGEDAFFQARQKDDRKLQALGGVQGHQSHGVCRIFQRVDIGDQGDGLEKGQK